MGLSCLLPRPLLNSFMADYHYKTNGMGRTSGFGFQSWGTPGNRYEATEALYGGSSALQHPGAIDAPRDHVCRPVIVGNDGGTMQALLKCPPRYHKDGYVGNGFSGVGGNARWNLGGDSYSFEKRNKAKDFFDHVQDAASSGYGLGLPSAGSTFPRQKADYGSYDAVGGAYGGSANGWGKRSEGGGWGAASYGTPLGKVTNSMEAAAESLLDSGRLEASAYAGGGWDSRNTFSRPSPAYAPQQNWKYGSTSAIDSKEAAKKYGGQFIW